MYKGNGRVRGLDEEDWTSAAYNDFLAAAIQGVGAVRVDLLVLVRRGCDDRVVSEELRKISRADWASSWEGL